MRPETRGATTQVTIDQIVDWQDTDAAGHYHHATVVRWVEAAEAELHEKLGILSVSGTIPRAHYEVDYRARLWFRDRVTITLWVDQIGGSSLRYGFSVARADVEVACGSMTVVHIDGLGRPCTWPRHIRSALSTYCPVQQG
ncbi:acyl-CoA thioesterase [Mycolicibacterium holsaticum]|uniref:acyl-CoA thioesterase n=1 Tax=Mycolicibacterium holsaticum TaxID=152142 RepID=UPI000A0460A2